MRFLLSQLNNYAVPPTATSTTTTSSPATVPDPFATPAATSPLFLDFPVPCPEQLGCIVCGRSEESILRAVRSMELDNLHRGGVFPVVRWSPAKSDDTNLIDFCLESAYEKLSAPTISNGRPKLLVIEGIQLLLPTGKSSTDAKAVAVFKDHLQEFCIAHDCTIIGTVPTPKMLVGKSYSSTKHNIYGSTQWGEGNCTEIYINPVEATTKNGLTPEQAELYRTIHVLTAGKPSQKLWAKFSTLDGKLLLTTPPEAPTARTNDILDNLLSLEPAGQTFSRLDFQAWGEKARPVLSERSVDRWIAYATKENLLIRTGQGRGTMFAKPSPN